MSNVVFNQDAGHEWVEIPHPRRLPPNPHNGGPATVAANIGRGKALPSETDTADSECPKEPKEQKRLRYVLLQLDQRSFLTGTSTCNMQAAYVLNAVRKNIARKQRVERILSRQKFHRPPAEWFSLDHIMNAVLLEADYHVDWDLYGAFCFVPSEEDAHLLLEALRKSNRQWDLNQAIELRYQMANKAPRPLDTSLAPFANPKWDVIILHPNDMLPGDLPMVIAQNRPLKDLSLSTTLTSSSSASPKWEFWIAKDDNTLYSLDEPQTPLPPFHAVNLRPGSYCLSTFAMIVNAHQKLESFMKSHSHRATKKIKLYSALIMELMNEIFYLPPGYPVESENMLVGGPNELPQLSTAPSLSAPLLSAPTLSSQKTLKQEQFMQNVDVVMDSENLETDFGPAEAPDTPDEDGLTDLEFDILQSNASNPNLDPKLRADSAMMMLYGADMYTRQRESEPASEESSSNQGGHADTTGC